MNGKRALCGAVLGTRLESFGAYDADERAFNNPRGKSCIACRKIINRVAGKHAKNIKHSDKER
jgi:hypothetical protein